MERRKETVYVISSHRNGNGIKHEYFLGKDKTIIIGLSNGPNILKKISLSNEKYLSENPELEEVEEVLRFIK